MQPGFVYLLPTGSLLDSLPKRSKPTLSRALVGRRLDGLGGRSIAFPFRTNPWEFHSGVQASSTACFGDRDIFRELGANKTLNLLDDTVPSFIRKGSGEMRDPREPNRKVDVRKTELIT